MCCVVTPLVLGVLVLYIGIGFGVAIPYTLLSLPGPMGELVVYFLSAWLSILSGTRYCVTALRGGLLSLLIEGEYVCPLGQVVVLV